MEPIISFKGHDQLAHLFGEDNVNVELWILRIKESEKKSLRLLYCMITLTSLGLSSEWRKSSFSKAYSGNLHSSDDGIPEIAKLSIVVKGSTANKFAIELYEGNSLGSAANKLNLSLNIDKFKDLKLGIRDIPSEEFSIRPPITTLSANVVYSISENFQGMTSPIKGALGWVGSIFRLNKEFLWTYKNGDVLPNAKALLNGCARRLTNETGLNFQHTDIKRLGNIEWISFPIMDLSGNPQITISTEKTILHADTLEEIKENESNVSINKQVIFTPIVKIVLKKDALPGATQVIVNCTLLNNNDVILDQCKQGLYPQDREFTFESQETISEIKIKVWAKNNDSNWCLEYQNQFNLFRTFSVGVSLGYSAPASEWLLELLGLSTNSKNKLKPDMLAKYNVKVPKDYKTDPWNPVGANLQELYRTLNPEKSLASFILPIQDDAEARRKNMADWFEKICLGQKGNTCVILDPYFDTEGIDILLSSNILEVAFAVIANCQCVSKDDDTSFMGIASSCFNNLSTYFDKKSINTVSKVMKKNASLLSKNQSNSIPPRATRIKRYCIEKKQEFWGKSFLIFDLRSKKKSIEQLFHDRYVLFFDKNGSLTSGYNLSNSLQGAMKKYPLLITPIPEDILLPVQEYIHGFLKERSSSKSKQLVQLFSTADDIYARKTRNVLDCGLDYIDDPIFLISILLGDSKITKLTYPELKDKLIKEGVLIDNSTSFWFSEQSIDYIRFDSYLARLSLKKFKRFWKSFAEALIRCRNSEEFYMLIPDKHHLASLLKSLLLNIPEDQLIQDEKVLREIALYRQAFSSIGRLSFPASFEISSQFTHVRRIIYLDSYFLTEAVRCLALIDQKALLDTFKIISEIENLSDTQIFILIQILHEIAYSMLVSPSDEQLSVYTTSGSKFLRSYVAHSLYNRDKGSSDFPNIKFLELDYSASEIILIFAEWTYNLRITANQKGGIENEKDKALRQKLFSYIIDNWPIDYHEILTPLFKRVCGPVFGSWAISNHSELALPLLEQGKISNEDLVNLWVKPLLKKIKSISVGEGNYYSGSDPQITTVAAHILQSSSIDEADVIYCEIFKTAKGFIKTLERPRIRSLNYSVWYNNFNALLLLQSFLRHLFFYEEFKQSEKANIISDFLNKTEPYTLHDSESQNHISGSLIEWAVEVKKKSIVEESKSRRHLTEKL